MSTLYQRLFSRLRSLAERARGEPSPRTKKVALVAAIAIFVGGAGLALRSLDLSLSALRITPLILAAGIGVPLTAVINGLEYVASGRIVGRRIRSVEALRISVLSTAANLLPIPGAALVRIQSLRQTGTPYRRATSSTLVVGFGWIGVSALLAGSWLMFTAGRGWAWIFIAVGVVAMGFAYVALAASGPPRRDRARLAALVLGVECLSVLTAAFRIYLVLLGLGTDANVSQGLVLAVAGSLSATAGIFPGGLGIRELLAGALSPIVSLEPAFGFLATALNRIIGIAMHAPIGLVLLQRTRQAAQPDERGTGEDSGTSPTAA